MRLPSTSRAAIPTILVLALALLGSTGGPSLAEFGARRQPPPSLPTPGEGLDIAPDADLLAYLGQRLQQFSTGACRERQRVQILGNGSYRITCAGQGPYVVPPRGSPVPVMNCAGAKPYSLVGCEAE